MTMYQKKKSLDDLISQSDSATHLKAKFCMHLWYWDKKELSHLLITTILLNYHSETPFHNLLETQENLA